MGTLIVLAPSISQGCCENPKGRYILKHSENKKMLIDINSDYVKKQA